MHLPTFSSMTLYSPVDALSMLIIIETSHANGNSNRRMPREPAE